MKTFEYLYGATPIDKNEAEGLIPTYISTQSELNALEQENILKAEKWLARNRTVHDVLSEGFLLRLHFEMFGDVWRWAGKYRNTDKSIGIHWQQIPTSIRTFLDNTRFQIENKIYDYTGLGARFHHRLVEIHPFANGNGRHSRYATDALLRALDVQPFTWGEKNKHIGIDRHGETRNQYIGALKLADQKNFSPLIDFVRS